MTSIAFAGDCTTTTALAVAAGWPHRIERNGEGVSPTAIIVETDTRGGSLAAWLDSPATPSISTAVTALHQVNASHDSGAAYWSTLEPLIQQSVAGPRFIPAPFRSREARTAINEASRSMLPTLAAVDHTVALLDIGAYDAGQNSNSLRGVDLVIVVHRQDASSSLAAAARLERLAEHVETTIANGHQVALALIGSEPFPIEEVLSFAAPDATDWLLPVDALAAAVLAGRSGVSSRRLNRLPLMRAAAAMASDLAARVTSGRSSTDHSSVPAPIGDPR